MKVHELIEQLQQLDQNAMVVISGYEGGVGEVWGSHSVTIFLNANDEWFYGEHEIAEGYELITPTSLKTSSAVYLTR